MVKIKYNSMERCKLLKNVLISLLLIDIPNFLMSCMHFLVVFSSLGLKSVHSLYDEFQGLSKVLLHCQSSKSKLKCSNAEIPGWPH